MIQQTRIPEPVDVEILDCMQLERLRSFFLYAGAGSGKTGSLVYVLEQTVEKYGRALALHSKSIAVITYTNAACDEIKSRLKFNPLVEVSTIHAFAWKLVEGFNDDIRPWVKTETERQIVDLELKKPRTEKTIREKERSLASKRKRLDELDTVRKFVYSPTGDNSGKDALSHSEVIKLSAELLHSKETLAKILVSRHPILLVDESQDTSEKLIEALLSVENQFQGSFCIGLFGDVMQRIYPDGKDNLPSAIPASWPKPAKRVNYRCPARILKLINKIRSRVDDHSQISSEGILEGHARLFVIPSGTAEKGQIEAQVATKMSEITGDPHWNEPGGYKALILEHHMAASRLGFGGLFLPLYDVDALKAGLLDGSTPGMRFLIKDLLPLSDAIRDGNYFGATGILRKKSPLLTQQAFAAAGEDQRAVLNRARSGIEAIKDLWASSKEPSILNVLNLVLQHGILEVPDILVEAARLATLDLPEGYEAVANDETKAWIESLKVPFDQLIAFEKYISGKAPFDTHQGVKGLEFPRVMVVIDDEARGFSFSYDKLLGVKAKNDQDLKNEREGKDSTFSRTARLFYVTCSRARNSLAVVAYTENPDAVKLQALSEGWFESEEIIIF